MVVSFGQFVRHCCELESDIHVSSGDEQSYPGGIHVHCKYGTIVQGHTLGVEVSRWNPTGPQHGRVAQVARVVPQQRGLVEGQRQRERVNSEPLQVVSGQLYERHHSLVVLLQLAHRRQLHGDALVVGQSVCLQLLY
ncbi:unnamed protein product [Leptidea sinapis]|uniref:Uncharacterized protein n=1 Tax=Leptidea sinapis TaxID=189913 RepID=A0A5E4R0L2_9NEOP|nr:unnamed protein product [Leptidea sinapis]